MNGCRPAALLLVPMLLFLGCAAQSTGAGAADREARAPASKPVFDGVYRIKVSVWVPAGFLWHLKINPNGSGYIGYIALPESYFPEGTFATGEVVRQLMPTLRTYGNAGDPASAGDIREYAMDYGGTGGSPYSVWINNTRYYPSDYNPVAALFDAVRPHMTPGDLEKLEMHPPPGLPLKR